MNFLKNIRLGLTIAPDAIKTSWGIDTINNIFALPSTYSLTRCRLSLFNVPSGRTMPILPPGFNRLIQRSMNNTSVKELIFPVSNKLRMDSPMLSLTSLRASSYSSPYRSLYFAIFSSSVKRSASVIFCSFSILEPNGGLVKITSKRFLKIPFTFNNPS